MYYVLEVMITCSVTINNITMRSHAWLKLMYSGFVVYSGMHMHICQCKHACVISKQNEPQCHNNNIIIMDIILL